MKFIKALFLQFSGIIGAGIFVLPYLFYHSNFPVAVSTMVLVAILMAFLNLFYIDIINATKGDHQLSGYAMFHLGPVFQKIALVNMLVLCFGAVFIYTHLSAGYLSLLLPWFDGQNLLVVCILSLVLLHLFHNRFSNTLSQLIPVLVALMVSAYFLVSRQFPKPEFVFTAFSPALIGSIVFALNGFVIIPEVDEALCGVKNKKHLVKLASLGGLALALLIYILFILAVIRISGSSVSPDSITGVFKSLPVLGGLLSVFGVFVTLKASLNMLLVLKEIFFRDFKVSAEIAYFLSLLPLILSAVFYGLPIIALISILGSSTEFVASCIICLIRSKFTVPPSEKILLILLPLIFLLSLLISF